MKKRKAWLISLLVATSLSLTACGGESDSSYVVDDYAESSYSGVNMSSSRDSVFQPADVAAPSKEGFSKIKKVDTGKADIKTEEVAEEAPVETKAISKQHLIRDVKVGYKIEDGSLLDVYISNLREFAEAYGGYTADTNMSLNNYSESYVNVRIPKDNVDDFLEEVGELEWQQQYLKDNVKDVTLEYTDVNARLEVQLKARDKYMEYLDRASTMDEVLSLESKIDQINSDIEAYTARLKTLNDLEEYTSIYIGIKCEHNKYEESLSEKVADSFSGIVEDCVMLLANGVQFALAVLVWIVSYMPPILLVLFIIIRFFKFAVHGNFKKKDSKKRKFKWSKRKGEDKAKESTESTEGKASGEEGTDK